jgi:hypothetical protein
MLDSSTKFKDRIQMEFAVFFKVTEWNPKLFTVLFSSQNRLLQAVDFILIVQKEILVKC